MSKIRIKNLQTAQGMVEFALVLPILLLVVLGVFAFGHMFFVYSSVVSASREAARWGAAVGTAGGAGGLPRYQDCGAIRAAAVRIGTFAGVSGNSVAIDYDSGPGTTVNSNHCIIGGTGPEVGLGDRIVVTVTVQYRPIVPFIDLPTFPLTATSARTIIKSLPVGEAPTARPLWPSTKTSITPNTSPTTPIVTYVGIPVTIKVKTEDDAGNEVSGGRMEVNDDEGQNCNPNLFAPKKLGVDCTFLWKAATTGTTLRKISAVYNPQTAQYLGSSSEAYAQVLPAETGITISSPLLTPVTGSTPTGARVVVNNTVDVAFQVSVTQGNNVTTSAAPLKGEARVNFNGNTICVFNLNNIYTFAVGSNTGPTEHCSIFPTASDLGLNTVEVVFLGSADGNYLGSRAYYTFLVTDTTPVPENTPTPNLTQTAAALTPGVTVTTVVPVATSPVVQPTSKPYCPYIQSGTVSFQSGTNSLFFVINNPQANANMGENTSIDKIQVTFPLDRYNVPVTQIRFGPLGSTSSGCVANNCLLNNLTGYPPVATFTSGFNAAVNSLPAVNNAETAREMLVVFGDAPRSGAYSVIVHFANNRDCQVQVDTSHE